MTTISPELRERGVIKVNSRFAQFICECCDDVIGCKLTELYKHCYYLDGPRFLVCPPCKLELSIDIEILL